MDFDEVKKIIDDKAKIAIKNRIRSQLSTDLEEYEELKAIKSSPDLNEEFLIVFIDNLISKIRSITKPDEGKDESREARNQTKAYFYSQLKPHIDNWEKIKKTKISKEVALNFLDSFIKAIIKEMN